MVLDETYQTAPTSVYLKSYPQSKLRRVALPIMKGTSGMRQTHQQVLQYLYYVCYALCSARCRNLKEALLSNGPAGYRNKDIVFIYHSQVKRIHLGTMRTVICDSHTNVNEWD